MRSNLLEPCVRFSGTISGVFTEQAVDWTTVPRLVHPMGGCLPEKRLVKKCQQLESMAAEVVKIVTGKSFFSDARPLFCLLYIPSIIWSLVLLLFR